MIESWSRCISLFMTGGAKEASFSRIQVSRWVVVVGERLVLLPRRAVAVARRLARWSGRLNMDDAVWRATGGFGLEG